MKRILLAGLILWSSISTAALPLKTRGQLDSSTTGQDTLRLEAPNSQVTKVGDQKVLLETGSFNVLKNPTFQDSTPLASWNQNSSISTVSAVNYRFTGKQSVRQNFTDTTIAETDVMSQTFTSTGENLSTTNMQATIWLTPNLYNGVIGKVCLDVNGVNNKCISLPNDPTLTGFTAYTFTFVGKGNASTYKLYTRIASSGTLGSVSGINYGAAYLGPNIGVGMGVPNNVFSAKVSSAGVVTDENEDWISGNCTNTGSPFTCTFVAGKFSVTPNCNISYGPSPSTFRELGMNTVSPSAITYGTYNSSGSASANNITIVCTRAGSDFIQPAITPNQWNYGPTAYTPTLGAGFGTPTNVSFFHWRTGKFLNVLGTFTTGAVSNGAVASISLPSGLTIDSAGVPVNNTTANPGSKFGTFSTSGSSSGGTGNIITAPATSTSLLYFSKLSRIGSMLTPSSAVSTDIAANTEVISVEFKIPIQGWTENQNAPQLVGSVTSNAAGALRIETAQISNNGSACAVVNQSSNWITGTAYATSQCTLTVAGDSNFPKWCLGSATQVSTGYIAVSFTTVNSTTIVSRTGYGTTDANAGYYMTCFGTR